MIGTIGDGKISNKHIRAHMNFCAIISKPKNETEVKALGRSKSTSFHYNLKNQYDIPQRAIDDYSSSLSAFLSNLLHVL
jgi:hypothetical protein